MTHSCSRRRLPLLSTFLPLPLLVLLMLVTSIASAQAIELSVVATGNHELRGSVALVGAREGNTTADLRLGLTPSTTGPPDALMLVRASRSSTIGLLGAATVELAAGVRTDGNGAVRLAGRGVLGPAALQAAVAFASTTPEALAFSGVAPMAPAPHVDGYSVALEAQVRYRIDRHLLVAVEPELVFTTLGMAARARGSLRARRLVEPFDGIVAFHHYLAPGDLAWSGAVGVGGIWVRRRAPEWGATAWLGWSDGRVRPGVELHGAMAVGRGVVVSVDLAAEAFRVDVPKYRSRIAVAADLGAYEGFVVGEATAGLELAAAVTAGVRVLLPPR